MTRKKKTIIGCCVGLLLVIVACAVANRWLLQGEDGYVVKNYIAQRCWHKNVGQFAQKFGFPYFATQMSCHQKEAMSTDADTLCPCPEATILLQPYDDFTQKEAYQLENELAKNLYLMAGGRGGISTGGGGPSGELTNWDGTKKRNGWGMS